MRTEIAAYSGPKGPDRDRSHAGQAFHDVIGVCRGVGDARAAHDRRRGAGGEWVVGAKVVEEVSLAGAHRHELVAR
ncbi:MAG: hypothetical protein V9F04_13165 [Dermatophilaceae bacterium]